MIRSLGRVLLASLLLTIGYALADAEEGRELPKVGQLFGTNPSVAKAYDEAFRDGLRSLGYVDGKNVILLPRYAHGDPKQFPALVSELIALNVDVLFAATTALPAATQATRTIPIVAPTMDDPVKAGFVKSFAHPGGNVTGGSTLVPETDSKRLQFAVALLPGLKHAGFLYEASYPDAPTLATDMRRAADKLGVTLHMYGVRNLDEIRTALAQFDKDRIQALIVWYSPLTLLHRDDIMNSASQKIPVIGEMRDFAEAGALITYSANYIEMWKRGGVYVGKILKGAKPGDLPIEQPTKFDLIINLRTAKALRITIPEAFLLQADEIIR